MAKNPPDWWARGFAVIGILIGIGGLVLTFYNSRWQKEVYQQSLEERVLTRLSAGFTFETHSTQETKLSPDGELGVEVVNLGTQPMYLKNISALVDGRTAHFYQHDPLNTKDSMRRLEPGEAATYTVDWQFAEQSLRNPDKQKVVVQVETTKKAFSQDVQINPVVVTAELPLLGRNFTQLLLLRPGRKKDKKAHQ